MRRDKIKIGLIIAGAVLISILLSFILLMIPSNRSQELEENISENSVYEVESGAEESSTEELCLEPVDLATLYEEAETQYAEENGYLTLEEAESLSDRELGKYLDDICWDAEFQEYVNETYEDVKDTLQSDPYYYHKLYLSEHPEIVIENFGNPYADNEILFEETYMSTDGTSRNRNQGTYLNSTVSLIYNSNGDTISIGTVNAKGSDGIYLTPVCSTATRYEPVGFYITGNRNLMAGDYEGDEAVFYEETSAANGIIYAESSHYIRSEDYYENLRWTDVGRMVGGDACEEDTLYIRMVRLENNELLGVFRVTIQYDHDYDRYYISGIYDNAAVPGSDVLSEDDFKELTASAVSALQTGKLNYSVNIGEEEFDTIAESCLVEFVPDTYFSQFTTRYREKVSVEDICTQKPMVCAVNVPVSGLGTITVYFVPYGNLLQSAKSLADTVCGSMSWALIGLDVPTI